MWSRKGVFMKKKRSKLYKLEKNRYSVFYESLSMCCNCGSMSNMTKHEIFEGRNRQNSMKYGFVLPLCLRCHNLLQNDTEFNNKWKKKSQIYFEEKVGSREEFIEIFRRNYL
jgi:hypothetical protein